MNHASLLEEVRDISKDTKEILPPKILLKDCYRLAKEANSLSQSIIGFSKKNRPIDLFSFGRVHPNVLLYGFPDPGEAVGGTGIFKVMKALVSGNTSLSSWNIRWLFIPCLNFDDQPSEGRVLKPVMRDPNVREVDWSLNNPRPETKALINLARKYRPIFSFPMHDEYHSREEILPNIMVSRELDSKTCDQVRACFKYYDIPLNPKYSHPSMGKGFLEMKRSTGDYKNSTFSVLDDFGTVAICEVSKLKNVQPSDLVGLQLSAGLTILKSTLL